MPVAIDGASERLKDLGFVKADDSWRIVTVRTHRRDATLAGWSPEGISATADADAVEATWLRVAAFLAVLGPGILAGLSDDDPAGIKTYSILGADHGYALIWVLVLATAMLVPSPCGSGP
ncbi:MAG: hypothetical protein M3Q31_05135 [Actinomycetota bacterium]|nr:hypothetical protein [Actinomycetota bacterium]